ncbi:MAG TPA: hypothetical protein VF808_10795 [Ktedonobacterales bacterium]
MNTTGLFGQQHWISLLYLGSTVAVFVGVMMFTYRVFLHGRLFPGFVRWERGLVALAAVVCVLGFIVLAAALRARGELVFSWVGLAVVALGAALIVVAELRTVIGLTSTLGQTVSLPELSGEDPLIVLGVALTFIGQAFYGVSLLHTALTPAWAGWLLVIWNLGWLVLVFLFSARDPYYPVLFYIGPVVLGILLWR